MGYTKRVSWHQRSLPCVSQKNIRTLDATPNTCAHTHAHTHTHTYNQTQASAVRCFCSYPRTTFVRPSPSRKQKDAESEQHTHCSCNFLLSKDLPFRREIFAPFATKNKTRMSFAHTRLMTFLPQQEIPWIAFDSSLEFTVWSSGTCKGTN